jgi:hypothetical protein
MPSPALCQHLSFQQSVKQLHVKQLVTQLCVEGFDKSVLSWTSRFDKQCPYVDTTQPVPNTPRRKLRTIIGTNVLRRTACHEQVAESFNRFLSMQCSGVLGLGTARRTLSRRTSFYQASELFRRWLIAVSISRTEEHVSNKSRSHRTLRSSHSRSINLIVDQATISSAEPRSDHSGTG